MATLNRREFLGQAAVAGAAGAFLLACNKGGGGDEAAAASNFSCTDESGLDDAQKGVRSAMSYVDATPDASKTCHNCALYTGGTDACGSCSAVPGPIHPNGYCSAWTRG